MKIKVLAWFQYSSFKVLLITLKYLETEATKQTHRQTDRQNERVRKVIISGEK
jgi:hypothetical protein